MKKLLPFFSFLFFAASSFALPNLLDRQLFKVRNIENLDVNLSWENLDIQECDEADNILVEVYCNNKRYAPDVKAVGSTIIIETNKYDRSFFVNKKCTVILRLPSTAKFGKARLTTTSGDIHSQMVITAKNFTATATSGDLSITEEVFADEAAFKATSGNIYIEGVFGEKLSAGTTSGSININKSSAEDCSVSATSGRLKLSNVELEQAKLETTSGSISLQGQVRQAFDISSTSGNLGLELDNGPVGNSRATATSGSIFLGLPGDANFSLNVSTTSGSFTNGFRKEKLGSHVSYNSDINGGGAAIKLTATSGNITVDSNDVFGAKDKGSSEASDIPVVIFDDAK